MKEHINLNGITKVMTKGVDAHRAYITKPNIVKNFVSTQQIS